MMFSTTTGSRCALVWQTVVLSAVVLLAGCADEGEQRTGMVSGKVTLDDAPVSAGTLLFMADDGHGDSAELGAGGTYSLQLRPGNYKVSVSPPPMLDPMAGPEGEGGDAEADAIPRKYHDFGTSGLTSEVKEGDSTFDISLESK